MKTFILLVFICFFASSFSQQIAHVEEVTLNSKILKQKRPLLIYTPMEYDERNLVSFDVVYVFDAQSREIFDLVHANLTFIFPKKKFIVVGIASPAYEKLNYYRNSDFLPKPITVSLEKYQTDRPNSENFWLYVKDEIIPFVQKNYRTTQTNYLIGHSLGASFVLDKAIYFPEMFKGFLCISPNLGYDNHRLANDFTAIDFNRPTENKFLFISQNNELETFPLYWSEAYQKVSSFLDSTSDYKKYDVRKMVFSDYDHWSGYGPALVSGLNSLFYFIENNPYTLNSDSKEITIHLTVPNKNDEVYIVGNQESLGNWNPSRVKLNSISDFEREITLQVKFPLEFKFTKGNWNTEGFTIQSGSNAENIVINDSKSKKLKFKILSWAE